jgi:phage terminase Nu1 subunit (DNA packaging protein)
MRAATARTLSSQCPDFQTERMTIAPHFISKAQLAEELGVAKSTVSLSVKQGLPVRADGKLNRRDAYAWCVAMTTHSNHCHKGRWAAYDALHAERRESHHR